MIKDKSFNVCESQDQTLISSNYADLPEAYSGGGGQWGLSPPWTKEIYRISGDFQAPTGAEQPPPLLKKGLSPPPRTNSWLRPWDLRIAFISILFGHLMQGYPRSSIYILKFKRSHKRYWDKALKINNTLHKCFDLI